MSEIYNRVDFLCLKGRPGWCVAFYMYYFTVYMYLRKEALNWNEHQDIGKILSFFFRQ